MPGLSCRRMGVRDCVILSKEIMKVFLRGGEKAIFSFLSGVSQDFVGGVID